MNIQNTKVSRISKRGFTLIELIITISILAILIAIVVVALNPAEQLQRSRDTKRVGDLDAMKTAINLYLAQATGTPNLGGVGAANDRCIGGTSRYFVNTTGNPGNGGLAGVNTSTDQRVATGTIAAGSAGPWMPAAVGQTPGGSPLSNLPLDPTNGTGASVTQYYSYACRDSNKTFEFNTYLESNFYKTDLDLDGTDGGASSSAYEVGTDLTIIN